MRGDEEDVEALRAWRQGYTKPPSLQIEVKMRASLRGTCRLLPADGADGVSNPARFMILAHARAHGASAC